MSFNLAVLSSCLQQKDTRFQAENCFASLNINKRGVFFECDRYRIKGYLYWPTIWSAPLVRNLGMATVHLEQSDSICRWFIRPLGPFGLVKHEVKPRPLSYVISHGECDTTLPTSIHLRSKDQSTFLLVVTTALQCFSLFVWAIISSFQKLGVCPICANWTCVGTKKFSTKHILNVFPLIGFNGVVSV